MTVSVVLGLCGLAAGAARAQYASVGVDLLSHVPLSAFPAPVPTAGSSCWGYTSPSGREYAILGTNTQTAFVEITNPTSPVIVGSIVHPTSQWNEMIVHGNYCYSVNENSGGGAASGLQVINLSNIDSGVVNLVTTVNTVGLTHAHTIRVNPQSGYLYLNGSNADASGGAIAAYSLANPALPVYAGKFTGPYAHDSQIVTYTSGPFAGREIAYCFSEGNGVIVVDVTNKASIFEVVRRSYAGVQYCHQGWLSEDRQYLYVNDELDGPAQGLPADYTRVFNVSNPGNPTFVTGFSSGVPDAIDHNNYVRGNLLFQSNYTSGLRIFDIGANPTNPPEVAWFDTHPDSNSASYNGTWNNYPYFASGSIAVSDINRGLFIVRTNLDYLTFSFPGGLPAHARPDATTPVTVQIATTSSPINPSTVTLYHRVGGAGAYTATPMTAAGGGQYTAELPTVPCLANVEYYFSAQNSQGRTFTGPPGTPAIGVLSTRSYSSISTILSYDMETAAGWTGGVAGDTATAGMWERGDPEGTTAQPADDHTGAPGVNCWITGRLAGAGVGSFDIDGGRTTLLSPVMNLGAAGPEARIGYWRWYSNNAGAAPNADVFTIEITNNGTTWVNVETVGPAGPQAGGGWYYNEFRIADKVPLSNQMQMRFLAEDVGSGSVVEAAIDDFAVINYVCLPPPCVTDYNQDGGGDNADVTDLANDIAAGTQSYPPNSPDFNNDGGADNADVTDLANVIAGGPCP